MNRRNIVLAALSCLVFALAAVGQSGHSSAESNAPLHEPRSSEVRTIDVDFPGGTAAEYVAALRKAAPDINIVVMGDAAAIQLPPVRLRKVAPWEAVKIMDLVPREQADGTVTVDVGVRQQGENVYVVQARLIDSGTKGRPEVMVYDVSELLAAVSAEDLLTVVEASLDLLKADLPAAEIRFHEATGLLIARGYVDQLSCITQVVQQVREKVQRANNQTEREHAHQMMMAEVNSLRQQLNEMKNKQEQMLAHAVELRTQNEMLRDELRHAQDEARHIRRLSESQQTECRNALEAAQRQIAALQREIESRAKQPQD